MTTGECNSELHQLKISADACQTNACLPTSGSEIKRTYKQFLDCNSSQMHCVNLLTRVAVDHITAEVLAKESTSVKPCRSMAELASKWVLTLSHIPKTHVSV